MENPTNVLTIKSRYAIVFLVIPSKTVGIKGGASLDTVDKG